VHTSTHLTVPSPEALNSNWLSGEKSSPNTGPEWPLKYVTQSPAAALALACKSYSRTEESAKPPVIEHQREPGDSRKGAARWTRYERQGRQRVG
jgi:hypothetical protein